MPPKSSILLGDLCFFVRETCDYSSVDPETYVSTDSMLPDKAGITRAESFPSTGTVRKYQPKDVLISNIRPYFKKIWQSDRIGTCSNDVLVIRAKDQRISDYLFALLSEDRFFDHVMLGSKGTKMPRGDKDQILTYTVCEISFSEMLAIGGWISLINQKISCNKAINDNLFQQAEKFYKHSIESNHLFDMTLSEICDFQEGYVNPSQKEESFFDGDVKWLRAVDINESYIIDTSRTLTQKGFQSAGSSAYLFEPDSIVISKSGTIGRLGIIADKMCGNRAVIEIKVKDLSMMPFVYLYLKSKQNEFSDMAVGSVQKNLYVSLLEPLIIKIPSEEIMRTINEYLVSIFSVIKSNCVEMLHLSHIRDYLLPKLMSGEIDVSTLEIPN